MLGHKTNLSKFKKIEIISSMFSYHNTMKLEINYNKKIVKNTNIWKLNSMLLTNQWITEEIKEEIKNYLETNENKKHNDPKPVRCSKSSSKREVYGNTSVPQETRKTSNNLPLYLKGPEK